MALQPVVGPWPLLQFLNHFYTDGRTPWTSDQPVARPLPTHRTTQIQNKRTHTDIHPLSGIRTHNPSVRASEDSSCLRPYGHRDWPSNLHIEIIYIYTKVAMLLAEMNILIIPINKGLQLTISTLKTNNDFL
jgi:hypothetical protein